MQYDQKRESFDETWNVDHLDYALSSWVAVFTFFKIEY